MKFTLSSIAIIAVGLLFMDTPERKANRCIERLNSAQALERIITINHLNSPLPWTRNTFQPTVPENVLVLD